MKVMLYEMSLFMQRDMEEILGKMGIDFRVFMYPFNPAQADRDDYFEKEFSKALKSGDYDGVISLNFWSPVARSCFALGIPYISWVYDCPFGLLQTEEVLRYPTNHIFDFDRRTCEWLRKKGIDTVVHKPLAVNAERLDGISLSKEDQTRFGADVSFVGTLYPSGFSGAMARLGEYERGYIEAAISVQSMLYGAYILESVTEGPITGRVRSLLEPESVSEIHAEEDEAALLHDEWIFRESLQSLMAKEITRRERLTILSVLSEQCKVALYSNQEESFLDKVLFRNTVDSYHEIYKVYKASRINLNITYKRIVTGIPLRVMDILGAGGFLLTNYQEEICEHFRPGVDLAVYESMEDAIHQALYYLDHEEERQEIAANGRRAVEKFAFDRMLREMIDEVFGEAV